MRPDEKGWLKNYLEFRKDPLENLARNTEKSTHPEYSLYRVIQPTGLMYGHSVHNEMLPDLDAWNEKDKVKVLLADSLVSSSLLFHDSPVNSPDDLSKAVMKAVENIGNFYNNIFPEMALPAKTLFGRRKSPLDLAEKILERRVELRGDLADNFWAHFFQNSLLFLDIYIFGQWIHTNADRIVADFFRYERDELRFSVVKVIAAASHSNDEVAFEEKRLFELFLQGTDLSSEKRKEALQIFANGVALENMSLPAENSWILKKFFLEIAILTIWADKKVEDLELLFLKRFCKLLDFSDDDLENSMIAVEGFILEHWEELGYLQNSQDYSLVSEQFIRRVARIAEKNRGPLLRKIKGSSDFVALLEKARVNELTPDEKEQIRRALLHVLKTIPTFVIVSLPQRFLTLPNLLKILPKELWEEI